MSIHRRGRGLRWSSALVVVALSFSAPAGAWTLVGSNDIGMHCMDADYSTLSLMPPNNTVLAQLVDSNGVLVTDPTIQGITVTYEAVADPDGSINSTSVGKTNFWENAGSLFNIALAPNVGLAGSAMPGLANQPQPMSFDATETWFIAQGIPITPYDDADRKNSFPLMHLVARQNGNIIASSDVTLPVSDEMDCRACHASASNPTAQPIEGWVFDPNPQRDMRLNILRLHDDRESFRPEFQQALSDLGYDSAGLYATTALDGKAVLCAACHQSNALPNTGLPGLEPLTLAVHRRMAFVLDPNSGLALDDPRNRSECYRCHPGQATHYLRGAMTTIIAPDGTLGIQCQDCHGHMVDVASASRTGWLDEPNCQSCHTGTAVHNNGEIRYASVFDSDGSVRVAVDSTYATNADTPSTGHSLYRFSVGHGGLACESCHGPAHAEYPSSQRNDNLQSVAIQGHTGVLAECSVCHTQQPLAALAGPHGMHPVGDVWVQQHPEVVDDGNFTACRDCHGADLRGTVLSRAKGDRVFDTDFGTKHFWPGFQIGCYTCHLGPSGESANPNQPALASDASLQTVEGNPVAVALQAQDPDGDPITVRLVSQPAHGTAAFDGETARYFPTGGYVGPDSFTFAAWDGSTDSNLGTVSINVAALVGDASCDGSISAADLVAVMTAIGNDNSGVCSADMDESGTVDEADLDIVISALYSTVGM